MNQPPPIPPQKPLAKKNDWICQQCHFIGKPKRGPKGSFAVEVALWLLFCAPGMIYSVWRLTSRANACPTCSSEMMIPCKSPRGLQMVDIK